MTILASLSVVVLGILELGSPFLLMNQGAAFHISLLLTFAALLGQCSPRPFRYSKMVLLFFLAASGLLLVLLNGHSNLAVKILVLLFSIFSCSASISTFLEEDESLSETDIRIMKLIGYGLSFAFVLSPVFILLLAYVLSVIGAYKCMDDYCSSDRFPSDKKAFFIRNMGYFSEGIFSYCIMSVLCFRGAAMFSQVFKTSEIAGFLSMITSDSLLILCAAEIFASISFALYKTASYFGVMPFAEDESQKRRFLVAGLLALSLYVQLRSLPAIGSALVFILTGFLFKEYISGDNSDKKDCIPGEQTYFRQLGLATAVFLLFLSEGNFSIAFSASIVAVLLSTFTVTK